MVNEGPVVVKDGTQQHKMFRSEVLGSGCIGLEVMVHVPHPIRDSLEELIESIRAQEIRHYEMILIHEMKQMTVIVGGWLQRL